MFDILVLTLFLINLLTNSAYSSIVPFYPLEASKKGIDPILIGFIFSTFSIAKSTAAPIAGLIMAKTGRKPLIYAGLILEASALICFGFIDYIEDTKLFGIMSAVCRLLEGTGGGFLLASFYLTFRSFHFNSYISAYAIVASTYPDKKEVVIGTLNLATGVGMLCGPVFGSILFVIGGFQLPFYVTGGCLYILTVFAFFVLPEKENEVPALYWSPNSGTLKENKLSYFECFKSVRVIMISIIAVCTMIQLTFKEPVLQYRLLELGINPKYSGVFFALDTLGFTIISLVTSNVSREKKDLQLLIYLCTVIGTIGLFCMGTIHLFGISVSVIPLSIGIFLCGVSGALCMNNSVAVIIDINQQINSDLIGELVNNIAAGLFTTCLAFGEAIGPISGSVSVSFLGGFVNAFILLNCVFVVLSILTAYHLAGKYFCFGHTPKEPVYTKIPGTQKKIIMIEGQEGNEYAKLENGDEDKYIEEETNSKINGYGWKANNVDKSKSHSSYDDDQENISDKIDDLKRKLLK